MNHKHCGVVKTLKIIGSKWTMFIIYTLFYGTKRFGELQRAIEGISPKTLSLRLQGNGQSDLREETLCI